MRVQAAPCPTGTGTTITGNDNTHYCMSNITITWWSANVWCDSIGQTLIDLESECYTVDGTAECPNLHLPSYNRYIWTRNQRNVRQSELIHIKTGQITGLEDSGIYKSSLHTALCK